MPYAPYNLGGYALSSTAIDFNWSESGPSVDAYWVYRWNGSYWSYIGSTTATAYNDYGLYANSTYYYTVCADNSAGYNCAATDAAITTTTGVTVPNAPYNLGGYALSSTAIDFNWSESSSNVDGYWVYRWTGSNWSYISSTASTYYNDYGLYSGVTYYYTVCAYNSAGYNCASTSAAVTTTGTTVPNAPYNLGGYAFSYSAVDFYWSESSSNVDGYWVYRWTGSNWSYIASTASTYYNDYGLYYGVTYYYTVCAYNSAGYNCASTSTAITT